MLPLEVELVRSFSGSTLHVGDEVLAKVRQQWTDGECSLKAASTVHGEVKEIGGAYAGRQNATAIAFHYLCHEQPEKLIWLALLAPEPVNGGNLVTKQALRSDSFGIGGGLRASGNEPVGGGGPAGNRGGGPPPKLDMSGRQNPSLPLFVETESDRKAYRPDAVRTGEVFKIPAVKLSVGAGPDDSTVIASSEKEVKLPPGSILILLPESAAVVTTAAGEVQSKPTTLASLRSGTCIGPGCDIVLAGSTSTGGTATASTAAGAAPPVQTAKTPLKNVFPLEVELIRSLTSDKMRVGDEVIAKLHVDWTDGTCTLPGASLIHGVVMDVSDPASKRKQFALEFRYRCKGFDPEKLVWLALIAPDPGATDASDHRVMRQVFHSASFGEGGGFGTSGNEVNGDHRDMSGRQNPTLPITFRDSEAERKAKRPDAVKTGQVWKMPHLKLDVGGGPEGSTVVSSTDKQVKLPMGTVLVLLPQSAAILPPTPAELAANAKFKSVPKYVPLPPIPELAACAEPACTTASSSPSAAEPKPLQIISLGKTGYHRLRAIEMRDLEYGAASAFLGDDHLLFTFNPHTLVPHEKSDRPEDHPHMVRAVLFNLKSGKAERTAEWRVHNEGQYLWIVDGSRIVVHDGDRLRWFGHGLHEEQSLKLDGPLAWLQISPDRKHYAVGTIRELHSKDEHAELLQSDSNGPEEQVAVQLLDDRLKSTDDGVQSSRALPPVLLDRGRVELRRSQNGHWYLREYPWSGGSEHRDFARMSSACMPVVKSLAADLVMAEGCDGSLDHWYRVFREDGQPVLKGVVHWREFSPLTADDGESGLFALAVPEGGGTYVRESTFHGADLDRETVRVHRSIDGRSIFETRMRFPLPARQPVALSPGGDRLAVIDGDEIQLYSTGTGAVRSLAQR